MMKKIMIAFFLVIILSGYISAWQASGFRWNTYGIKPYEVHYKFCNTLNEIDLSFFNPNDVYHNSKMAWILATGDWSSRQDNIKYRHVSSSNNVLSTINSQYGFFGIIYLHTDLDGHIVRFTSELNRRFLSDETTNFLRSVANHELGHSLGLGDISTGTAVMNIYRNRNVIFLPQIDDVSGVNMIYFDGGI